MARPAGVASHSGEDRNHGSSLWRWPFRGIPNSRDAERHRPGRVQVPFKGAFALRNTDNAQ